jgi:hypothetical protein
MSPSPAACIGGHLTLVLTLALCDYGASIFLRIFLKAEYLNFVTVAFIIFFFPG